MKTRLAHLEVRILDMEERRPRYTDSDQIRLALILDQLYVQVHALRNEINRHELSTLW
tara:strand:- start:1258 stop:1431 length:174 start_codon:yes stop_codon:yes gene_type:complete